MKLARPPESDIGSDQMPPLSAEHQRLRQRVREVAEEAIAPDAARLDQEGRFPSGAHRALVDAGLYAPHIPVEYGGLGADALTSCLIVEEVARVCASSSLIPNVTRLATLPLLAAGDERLKQRYLPPVARDGALFSFALSEREAGSDAASIQTRATRDGDSYVIDGTKRWITNASVATYHLVMAVAEPGVSAFVVHADDPGVRVGPPEDKLGVRASPTCEVYLDHVRIPADRLVGEEGEGLKLALCALDHSRVTIAAQAVGIAQGALDYTVNYIRQRRQFGKAIAAFQGVRFMVADMAMQVAAARELTYAAAVRSAANAPDLRFFSAAAKCFASDVAMRVTTDAVQLLGGNGYTRGHPVERMMRDAKVTQVYEGSNQIQRVIMSRAVLGSERA